MDCQDRVAETNLVVLWTNALDGMCGFRGHFASFRLAASRRLVCEAVTGLQEYLVL